MKKYRASGAIAALILAVMMLTSCGKSEFKVTENTGKLMTISAVRAEKDAFFSIGSIEVDDGEKVVISSDMKKGSIRVEVYGPDQATIDSNPDLSGEVALSADLAVTDGGKGASATMPAGSYQVKATCLETATGTVRITAEPEADADTIEP